MERAKSDAQRSQTAKSPARHGPDWASLDKGGPLRSISCKSYGAENFCNHRGPIFCDFLDPLCSALQDEEVTEIDFDGVVTKANALLGLCDITQLPTPATTFPSKSQTSRLDAVISSNAKPNGLTR